MPNNNFLLYPTDIDGDPITFDGNPAHMSGVLYEIQMCIERTGTFKLLVEENVVLVGSKLAIDHPDAISFLKRTIADSNSLLNGASKFGTANP